jgi:hypothetical protein
MGLAVFTRTGHGHVVSIQHESERPLEVLAQCVKVRRGNFKRRSARVTREVPVHGASEMEDGGVLIQMGVHDDLQILKLFEYSIDRRRTHLRSSELDLLGDLVGGEMTGSGDQDIGDGALGNRNPLGGATNRREYLIDFWAGIGHGKTLGPSN